MVSKHARMRALYDMFVSIMPRRENDFLKKKLLNPFNLFYISVDEQLFYTISFQLQHHSIKKKRIL